MINALRSAVICPRLPHKAGMAAALVAAADILFHGRVPGISAALFVVLLAAGIWYANRLRLHDPAVRSAAILTVAGCFALAENVSLLSGAFALAGLIALATPHRANWFHDAARWPRVLFRFTMRGWLQPFRDTRVYRMVSKKRRCNPVREHQLIAWVLPLAVSLVFIGLFADANPIVFDWLAAIADIDSPDSGRVLLWIAVAFLCWPFIRPRPRRFDLALSGINPHIGPIVISTIDTLFSTDAIVRSLVIFNAIFAVQTALDATYLWGGLALPDGMTYAQYAHRGAYPLVVAALLAAGFVLIAMRPGSESVRMPLVRVLIHAWVAQTIILVGASAWRTGLYVSAYSLTYLRVAAFVWMILVAIGLLWIVLRLAMDKSGAWLVKVNMLTAMGVLYIFCFVDVGGSIAWFNVEHSRAGTARGYSLDLDYLKEIGPPALPALDWYVETAKTKWREESPDFFVRFNSAGTLRNQLTWNLTDRHRDWRSYSFRSYRLALDVGKPRIEIYAKPPPDGEWTVE